MNKPLLVGVGNRYRGDDGAGLKVAEILHASLEIATDVYYSEGDPIALLDVWSGKKWVFLIDTVASEGKPLGYLHIFPLHNEAPPAFVNNTSTHFLDLLQIVELARALHKLPSRMFLYGIEALEYGMEPSISPSLCNLLPKIAEEVKRDLCQRLLKGG